MTNILERYNAAKGDKRAQAQLMTDFGYTNWGSVTSTVSRLRRVSPTAERPKRRESKSSGFSKSIGIASQPLDIKANNGMVTIPIFGDTHQPFIDSGAFNVFVKFLVELQPPYLIHDGDADDFYQISPFDKNPDRVNDMQADLDRTNAMFRNLRRDLPNTRMFLLEGNHEDRLRRFLWTKANILASLRCLELSELYGLKEFEVEPVPYERGLMINKIFLAIHGNIASVHSSYTAKRMFLKHGGCGICGHTHRGGSFYKRNRFGIWGWWENWCFCDLEPDWIKNPDWQHGFSLVHFKGDRFWVEQVPILNGKFMYGGRMYD